MSDPSANELILTHQAAMVLIRREGRRRLAFHSLLAFLYGMAIIASPPTLILPVSLLGIGWVGWCLWQMRPGLCVICAKRTSLAMPGPTFHRQRWWAMWPVPRSQTEYVCDEHAGKYLLLKLIGS